MTNCRQTSTHILWVFDFIHNFLQTYLRQIRDQRQNHVVTTWRRHARNISFFHFSLTVYENNQRMRSSFTYSFCWLMSYFWTSIVVLCESCTERLEDLGLTYDLHFSTWCQIWNVGDCVKLFLQQILKLICIDASFWAAIESWVNYNVEAVSIIAQLLSVSCTWPHSYMNISRIISKARIPLFLVNFFERMGVNKP